MMRLKFQTWEDYHHQIYRIYHGIIAVSLLPFFLLFLELEVTSFAEPRVSEVLVWLIIILFVPGGLYVIWWVWKGVRFKYSNLDELSLKEKLVLFRKTEVRKFLWLELVCVVALVGLWLTAHYLFIILYFSVLAQFSFLRPSEDRLIRILMLNKEERSKLHSANFQ